MQQPPVTAGGAHVEVCHTGLEHVARHQQWQLADQNGGFSSRGHWRAHEDFLFPHATQQQFQRDALEDVVPARQKKTRKWRETFACTDARNACSARPPAADDSFGHVLSDAVEDAQTLCTTL